MSPPCRVHVDTLADILRIPARERRQRGEELDQRGLGRLPEPEIAEQVRRLREEEGLDFRRIEPCQVRAVAIEEHEPPPLPRSAVTGTPAPLSASMSR